MIKTGGEKLQEVDGLCFPTTAQAEELARDLSKRINGYGNSIDAALDVLVGECIGLTNPVEEQIKRLLFQGTSVEKGNIHVVGSCRLGFSPISKTKPDGTKLTAGRPFSLDSDIDIAIIDNDLYCAVWEDLFIEHPSLHATNHGAKLSRYHLRGWLRPDLMPFKSTHRRILRRLGNQLTKTTLRGRLSANVGLWKNEMFFLEYYKKSLEVI